MLKAIKFDGRRFYSELEARWAVFFKKLGIKYEYQKEYCEGFLSDFWLPEQDCLIEIRFAGQPSAQDLLSCSTLAANSGKRVFMFSGQPYPASQRAESSARAFLTLDTYYPGEPDIPSGVEVTQDLRFIMQNYAWGICPFCRKPNIWKRIESDGHFAIMIEDECNKDGSITLAQDDSRDLGLIAAYTAARLARFDHGKRG